MKDFTSKPSAFKADVAMLFMQIGTIIHAAFERYVPAVMLSYKKRPIDEPRPIYTGIIRNVTKIANFIADWMRLLAVVTFPVAMSEDMSGISVIASEPINVDGRYSNGKVMPIAMPYWASACSFVYPTAVSESGTMIAISGISILETMRTPVIADELLSTFLNSPFGEVSFPFTFTKVMMTKIEDKTQAITNDMLAVIAPSKRE